MKSIIVKVLHLLMYLIGCSVGLFIGALTRIKEHQKRSKDVFVCDIVELKKKTERKETIK